MHVAVIGLGIGENHVRALVDTSGVNSGEDVTICDVDRRKLNAIGKSYDVKNLTTSYQEVLNTPDIDVITLATPPYLHEEMVTSALESGKHVYCEKPLSTTFSSSKKLVQLAVEKGLALTVGFNMRHYGEYEKASSLLRKGVLDSIVTVESYSHASAHDMDGFRLSKEKSGGGCLIDSGSHRFDLLRWLIGPIKEIQCFEDNLAINQMEGEDTATVNLRFEGGTLGTLNCTWATGSIPRWDEGLDIFGTDGFIKIRDSNHSLTLNTTEKGKMEYSFDVNYEKTFQNSIYGFLRKIRKGEVGVDRVKTLASSQAVSGAYRSANSNEIISFDEPI